MTETKNKCKMSLVLELRKGAEFEVIITLKEVKHSCGNSRHLEVLKKTYQNYDKQRNMILSRRMSSLVKELQNVDSCITVVEFDASNYDEEELCAICLETLRCGYIVTLGKEKQSRDDNRSDNHKPN
ncbi:hypothetical protein CCACVL1_18989 [Corchorus capsularis]|uniref:Uncharacterized protein n=1 Tax=Corchorus capsularis TaxID=210143 RepID=A0A1R3HJ03_COCAP|nr:hypothetical protein CCACVL1_18989 [Corchorus capsularis]